MSAIKSYFHDEICNMEDDPMADRHKEVIVLTVNDRGGELWANNAGVYLTETPNSPVIEIEPERLSAALQVLLQELSLRGGSYGA